MSVPVEPNLNLVCLLMVETIGPNSLIVCDSYYGIPPVQCIMTSLLLSVPVVMDVLNIINLRDC